MFSCSPSLFFLVELVLNVPLFFQTPRILEATEKRQDPASPIQEITKMGYLQCKTDIADGKVGLV